MSQLEDTQDYNEDHNEDQDTDEEFDLEAHQEYQKYQSEINYDNYQDIQQYESYEPYERHEKSRPVVDNRGYKLIQISNQIMASANTIFSKYDLILAHYETGISEVEKKYQHQLEEFMKTIHKNKERDLSKLRTKTQESLDNDANVVKIQEYRNQSLEHLAQTCLSLSTQTTEVLDQALPVYEDKINRVMLEGKLTKILGIVSPKNYFEFGFLPEKGVIINPLFVYVEKVNDFAYIDKETLVLGINYITLQFKESDYKILKTYDGLVYLMIGNKVTVYDTNLNVMFTIDSNGNIEPVKVYRGLVAFAYQHLRETEPVEAEPVEAGPVVKIPINFYVYEGSVTFTYQYLRGYGCDVHVRFGKVFYQIGVSTKTIVDTEVVGDKLAIITRRLLNVVDGVNNIPYETSSNNFDDAVVIAGYVYTYKHTPDGTEIDTPNGKVLYHGCGSLYPGPSGSAFYVQNSKAILVDFV